MAPVRRARRHEAATVQPCIPPPCRPRRARAKAGAEPGDLGREIAAATLDAARRSTDGRGLALEVADPEPLLRGVASAYAAIARTLPGGLDEAWALLGLLALELEDAGAGRPSLSDPDTSGTPWPERHEPRTGDRDDVAAASETGTNAADPGNAWLAATDRHIAETEAHLVHQAVLIGQMAAQGRATSLADTLLWLTGQTLDAPHEHRRALLEEAARAQATAGPGSPPA